MFQGIYYFALRKILTINRLKGIQFNLIYKKGIFNIQILNKRAWVKERLTDLIRITRVVVSRRNLSDQLYEMSSTTLSLFFSKEMTALTSCIVPFIKSCVG